MPNQDLILVDTTDLYVQRQTDPFFIAHINLFSSVKIDSDLSFRDRGKCHRKFEGPFSFQTRAVLIWLLHLRGEDPIVQYPCFQSTLIWGCKALTNGQSVIQNSRLWLSESEWKSNSYMSAFTCMCVCVRVCSCMHTHGSDGMDLGSRTNWGFYQDLNAVAMNLNLTWRIENRVWHRRCKVQNCSCVS